MSGRQEIRIPGQPEPISHYTDAVCAGPASALAEVSALAIRGAKLEVEAVALIP